jgi:hypothetical protein
MKPIRSSNYERFIQRLRIGIAIAFAVCAIGATATAVVPGIPWVYRLSALCGLTLPVLLLTFVLLIVEQFVVGAVARFRIRFSIGSLLGLTTVAAVFAAIAGYSVAIAITLFLALCFLITLAFEQTPRDNQA